MTFLTIFLALAAYSEVHGLQNPEAKVGVENIECYVRQDLCYAREKSSSAVAAGNGSGHIFNIKS